MNLLRTTVSAAIGLHASTLLAKPYEAPRGPVEKPHLYEIRKGDQVSWLFGTIHRGVSLSEVERFVRGPLSHSKRIVLEIVAPKRSAARAQLWKRDPIQAILTSPSFDFKSGEKLNVAQFEYLTKDSDVPMRLARALRTGSCEAFRAYFYLNTPEMEVDLETYARAHGQELLAVDSVDLRNAADRATGVPTDGEKKLSCELIDEVRGLTNPSHDTLFERLVGDYRRGTVPDEVTTAGHALRNHAWIKNLRVLFDQGGTFVAVGAAHLYGEEGLLKLLSEQGFEVRSQP